MEHFLPIIVEALHVPDLWESLSKAAFENPWLTFFGLLFLAVIFVRNFIEILHDLITFGRRARFRMAATGIGIVLVSGAAVIYLKASGAPVPVFDPVRERVFMREPAAVSWRYSGASPANPVVYEVQVAKDATFRPDTITHTERVDGRSYYSYQTGGTRSWRVRAIKEGGATSGWSKPVTTVYYPDAFSRIQDTQTLVVHVSNSINQSIFKYVNARGELVGADIDIANAIAREVESSLRLKKLTVFFSPMPWRELLGSLRKTDSGNAIADLIISSITKREAREKENEIKFSPAYYCTTLSLVSREPPPRGPLANIIDGKSVVYQAKTTSQALVEVFGRKVEFRAKEFEQTRQMIDALLAGQGIDFAITDSPFAVEEYNKRGGTLHYRPLSADDFKSWNEKSFLTSDPKGKGLAELPREMQIEEYAVAVHNSEDRLAKIIDDAIKKWTKDKKNGLAELLQKANQQHAAANGKDPAEQWKQLQAAECPVSEAPAQ